MQSISTPAKLAQRARAEWKESKHQFLASLSINAIILIPIALSIHLYLDDYPRALFGTFGWDNDARPAASLFFFLLNFGTPLVAASPLYQCLALIFISIACTIAVRAFNIKSTWLGALCTLPIIGQPYFLANLSFGFDSASMALAQLLAIAAATVLIKYRGRHSFILSTILLIVSLLTYQACASSFLIVALMLCLDAFLNKENDAHIKDWLGSLQRSLGCYVISLAIFGIYARFGWQARSAYAIESSKLLPIGIDLPASILHNAITYLKTYWSDWAHTPAPLSIAGLSLILIGSQLGSKQRVALTTTTLILVGIFAPGASLLLASPPAFLPRTLVFVGPLLSTLSLLAIKSSARLTINTKAVRAISLILISLLAWLCILVSFAYVHASQAQHEFEAGKVSRLINQINRLRLPDKPKNIRGISYTGGVQRAPQVQNTVRRFPVIDRLIFRLIANNNDIGLAIMNYYGLPPLQLTPPPPEDLDENSCTPGNEDTSCSAEFILQIKDEILNVRILQNI